MIEMSLQEDHSQRLTRWSGAGIADGRSSRRAVYRRGVAILALLLTLSIGVPSTAGAQVPTVTSTRHERVRTPGEYAIVVSIPPVAVAQSITVSAGNQVKRNVQIGSSTVHLAFHVDVPHRSYSVLATSKGTPVHFTVAEALQQSPSGATGPSGTTGQTGATGASSPTGVVDIGPPNGPYSTLVWSDEFNGPSGSPPNPVNWTADDYGACGTGTLSTPTQDLANGSLNGAGDLAISALAGPAGGYSSASLDSYGKFSFEYGRLAARIEEPAGVGLCAQFWLLGNSATLGPDCWPNCGEIDVHEALGNFPLQADAFLHGPVPNQPGYQQWGSSIDSALPLTSGFHTYGITWRPNKITWTIDGVPWVTVTPRSLTNGSNWVFNGNPFHVILDLAVGGWPGPPNASTKFPATMLVDWIRLYQ